MAEFRAYISYLIGFVLLFIGLSPILNLPSYIGFDALSYMNGTLYYLIVGVGALWLAIDGFGESHFFKTITLAFAAIMAILIAFPVMATFGIPISLPSLIYSIQNFIFAISGILLLIGPLINGHI